MITIIIDIKVIAKIIVIAIVLIFCVLLIATFYNLSKNPNMYISKTKLPNQEESITKLLGINGEQCIYDFKLDNTVQSIQINTYKLKNGIWELISGGGSYQFCNDSKGKLALDFKNINGGLKVVLQSKCNNLSTKHFSNFVGNFADMEYTTSILDNLTEVTYEKEIPLVIQILTTKNYVSAYSVDYFFTPNEYEKYNYDYVYAITVKFSQSQLNKII